MNRRPHPEESQENGLISGFSAGGRLPVVVLFVSAVCFVSSLFFPALVTEAKVRSGLFCVLFGWIPARPLFNALVWWANPLLIASCVLVWRDSPSQRVMALIVSLAGLLLALSGFVVSRVVIDRAGAMGVVTGHGPGFYLWLLSFPGPLLFFVKRIQREPAPPPDDPEEEGDSGVAVPGN